MQMKKTELVEAAKELNEVLGLDPQINIKKVSLKKLREGVLEAVSLIEPEDEVSSETLAVIKELKEEQKGELGESESRQEDTTKKQESEPDEEENEEEEEEVKEKVKEEVKVKKEVKVKEKEKASIKEKEEKVTRVQAAGLAIRGGKGKKIKISNLVERADRIFVEAGGSSNLKESTTAVNKAVQVLAAFGAIRVEGDIVE